MSEFLHLMKLGMGRHPNVNVEVNISILIEAASHYYNLNDAISLISGGGKLDDGSPDPTNAIYIADLKDEIDYFMLLLVRGDPKRRIPSFVNMHQRIVKPVTPQDAGDVPGASAHLLVSKAAIAGGGDQGRYRMVIEKTTGLSRVLARDFLTGLMARYAEEFPANFVAVKRRKSKKEKPEQISYRPTCRFHPQPNASLKNDLESGKIGGFKLVRGVPSFRGQASSSKIHRVNVSLTAQIAPTEDFNEVRRAIILVKEALSGVDFEGLNLELIDDGGHEHQTRMLPIDQIDEPDMRYCKTIQIQGLTEVGQECYSEFQPLIVKAAKKAIEDPTHWN
ncbi:hypothetical protein ACQZ44_02515 [Agrobacterium vitis]